MNERPTFHKVILLIGSNIHPHENIQRAVEILRSQFSLTQVSSIIETEPYRSTGDNFLNLAVEIDTGLPPQDLKSVLRQIEADLGRIRTADKYAPRTIDLDITVFDGKIVDEELWVRAFVACPVADLMPDLMQAETGKTIHAVAEELMKKSWMRVHPAPSLD